MRKPKVNRIDPIEKTKRDQWLEDIKFVMSSAAGRRFVWGLLEMGNIFRVCFTGNSTTFYNEGKRELLLPIYSDIMEKCPELFHAAQRENFISNKPEEEVNSGSESDDTGA